MAALHLNRSCSQTPRMRTMMRQQDAVFEGLALPLSSESIILPNKSIKCCLTPTEREKRVLCEEAGIKVFFHRKIMAGLQPVISLICFSSHVLLAHSSAYLFKERGAGERCWIDALGRTKSFICPQAC